MRLIMPTGTGQVQAPEEDWMSEGNGKGIDLGSDDGFVMVRTGGEDYKIDVWAAYWDVFSAAEDQPRGDEFSRRCLTALEKAGVPTAGMSLWAGERFAEAIFARVKELKKGVRAGDSPASPASTEPPSAS